MDAAIVWELKDERLLIIVVQMLLEKKVKPTPENVFHCLKGDHWSKSMSEITEKFRSMDLPTGDDEEYPEDMHLQLTIACTNYWDRKINVIKAQIEVVDAMTRLLTTMLVNETN